MSVAWIMGWTIFLIMHGLQGGIQTTGDMLEIPVLLFGPPVALLLFGVAAGMGDPRLQGGRRRPRQVGRVIACIGDRGVCFLWELYR